VGYCHVDDIKKSLEVVLENGGQTQQEIKDVGGGKLIATVEEADGERHRPPSVSLVGQALP
jgi:predicted enzyme related to lactoylglutathione lyase